MPNPDARGVAPAPPTDAELEAIRARADVVRPLLKSISAWPWKSVKVDEEGWPCIPHPHFDFYQEVQAVQVVEERAGYLHARVDANTPTTGNNVGCYLGTEADADFIVTAPQVIRSLRDDVWALLSALSAARARADQAERALQPFAQQGVADYWGDDVSVSGMVGLNVTAGDFRAARRALASASPDPTDTSDEK